MARWVAAAAAACLWALREAAALPAEVAEARRYTTVSALERWPLDEWFANSVEPVFARRLRRLACTSRAKRCRGFALLPPYNFTAYHWRTLREQDWISLVTSFHQSFARQDPVLMRMHHFITAHIEAAVRDCAGGAVTALAYGLSDISESVGDEAALEAFKMASHLHWALRGCGGSDWELMRPGSTGTRFAPNFPALSGLFGLTPRTPCGGRGAGLPSVFVRDVGRSGYFVRCSTGLRSTETWFHRQLLHSDCAAEGESDADFIFVPLYSVCNHLRMQNWTQLQDHAMRFPFVRPYFELADAHQALLRQLRAEAGPLDRHLVLLPEEKWPLFGAGTQSEERPRLLVVEARPVHCTHYDQVRVEEPLATSRAPPWRCFHCHNCFRPGFDVVVPSFVDFYTRTLLLGNSLPYSQRRMGILWFGNGGPDSSDGTYCEVINWRGLLASLKGLPEVMIGSYHESYEELMGESKFCLVPKGLGYWTHRLYEAVLAGCIPVILSDHVVLPFQGVAGIDWAKFSVKWPEDFIGKELYEWLAYLANTRGAQLREALDEARCWFDYHSDGDCNPLRATMMALSTPPSQRLPPFWNSPSFPWRSPEEQFLKWAHWRDEANNVTPTPVHEVFHERALASQRYGGLLA